MKWSFTAALCCLIVVSLASRASAGFTLVDVEAGVEPAPIVLFDDAPPLTRQAAEELAHYIEQVCGARPKLLTSTPQPLPERAIWVGYQPTLKELFPEVDFSFHHPEEILIASNDKHLVIAGRDRWDPKHLTVEGIDEKIVGHQQEYGTVNAIYTFLQDQLGIRWLWPGELGEDVPRQKKIVLEKLMVRYYPQIRARAGLFNFSRMSNRGYGRAHLWTRRQRLQLDSLRSEGGHGFGHWWDRHHETQPELFALQPDGTRSGWPSPRTAKLCMSNPAVWQQWLADVEEQLKKDPTRTEFNASPNDGWFSGHCVCENCRAWDHPDGEPREMHWAGKRRELRPALSDRDVTFANRLAALLKERYPDKDYKVFMLSYGHSRPAPVKAKPADNVIIISVANFFGRTNMVDRGSTRNTTHREQFAAWGKLTGGLIWRPNTGSPAGWQQGLPDVSVAQTIEDFKFVAKHHCIGVYVDSVWEHWATQGPQYYVMAQLTWNPASDGKAILADYYRRAFGPAADDVRAYFEHIESARMPFVEQHAGTSGARDLPRLYTDTLLAQAQQHLHRAAEKVAAGNETYRQRVAFVQAGLDYTRLVIDISNDAEQYWQTKDEALGQKLRANWTAIEKLCQAHPYAINYGPVRPSTPRMIGLHPDYPDPKWKPRPKDLDLE